jgi:hypothetical protein
MYKYYEAADLSTQLKQVRMIDGIWRQWQTDLHKEIETGASKYFNFPNDYWICNWIQNYVTVFRVGLIIKPFDRVCLGWISRVQTLYTYNYSLCPTENTLQATSKLDLLCLLKFPSRLCS